MVSATRAGNGPTDLGNGKETLGERDDVLHLGNFIDAVFHCLCVFGTRAFKHTFDASNVVLGPLLIWHANDLLFTQIHISISMEVTFSYEKGRQ
jgi:hypothetical protein